MMAVSVITILLILTLPVIFLIGLINPKLILRNWTNPTRKTLFKYFALSEIILIGIFLLIAILFPSQSTPTQSTITEMSPSPTQELSNTLNDSLVSNNGKALSEAEKKEIYIALISAERRAFAEAEAKYPTIVGTPGFSHNNVQPNAKLTKELTEKYTQEVYMKYSIDANIAANIIAEALKSYWSKE